MKNKMKQQDQAEQLKRAEDRWLWAKYDLVCARVKERHSHYLFGCRDETVVREYQWMKKRRELAEIEHADAKTHLKQVKRGC